MSGKTTEMLLSAAALGMLLLSASESDAQPAVNCRDEGIPPIERLPSSIDEALKNVGVPTNQLEFVLFVKNDGTIDAYRLSNITSECWQDRRPLIRPGRNSERDTNNALVITHSSPATLVNCRVIGGRRVCEESQ